MRFPRRHKKRRWPAPDAPRRHDRSEQVDGDGVAAETSRGVKLGLLEAKLAQKMGHLASSSIVGRVIKCLQSYNLPTQLPSSMDFDALLQKHDCPFDFCFFFLRFFSVS